MAKFLTISLIYSSALPLAYGMAALFLWLAQWIDRINLLRRLEPPPRSPATLIGLLLRGVLPIAIFLHLVCAVMFYSQELGVLAADPLCPLIASPPPAPPPPSPAPQPPGAETAAAALGVVEASGQEAAVDTYEGWRRVAVPAEQVGFNLATYVFGVVGTLTVSHSLPDGPSYGARTDAGQPCQTAMTLAEAYTSVAIVWLSAWIWGVVVLVYAYREWRRPVENGLHLVDDDEGSSVVAKFLDLGFADAESTLLSEAPSHQAGVRRRARHDGNNLYVPPLPRSVLASLHTVSERLHKNGGAPKSKLGQKMSEMI